MNQSFIITRNSEKFVKKYGVLAKKVEFKLLPPLDEGHNYEEWFENSLKDIFNFSMENVEDEDLVGIVFCGQRFSDERGAGFISLRKRKDLVFEDILEMLAKIFQSSSEGVDQDNFCLETTIIKPPRGTGRSRAYTYTTFEEECRSKRGIIVIKNSDNLCFVRALVVAMAAVDKNSEYQKIRKTEKMQMKYVKDLLEKSKIEIPADGVGIPEIQKFQSYLDNYKITVYNYGTRGRSIMFQGEEKEKKINLLFYKNHFNVIRSLTATFGCGYYCESCHVAYQERGRHYCGGVCIFCGFYPKCKEITKIECNECNRSFVSSTCFENHTKPRKRDEKTLPAICEEMKRCIDCKKCYKASREHTCGEVDCTNCRAMVMSPHHCYIKKDEGVPPNKDYLFVFYDYETNQENVVSQKTNKDGVVVSSENEHVPNLLVLEQRCYMCEIFDETVDRCNTCGVRTKVIRDNITENFVTYLLNIQNTFKKGITCIAHYASGFDLQFVLNYILQKTNIEPDRVIMRGTKIIMMRVGKIKFIDSLNYLPMSLSALPKAFNLGVDLNKLYFPHLFNTTDNQSYKGSLPDIKYYAPDTMKPEDREKFLKWYEDHKDDDFDMKRDLELYCVNDVRILTKTCLKFRKMMLKECGVDPFIESVTLASAINLSYRRHYLKDETISIIPPRGYRCINNQSEVAVMWLLYEEKKRGIEIIHGFKQREVQIGSYSVDGLCESTGQIFEFLGCYWHGCEKCQLVNRDKPLGSDKTLDTLNSRLERTLVRANFLKEKGFDLIEMRECDFIQMLENDKQLKKELENDPLFRQKPLKPRDAFYGGRTGNTKIYYKCKEDEKINYIDICSLYPWVCKRGFFPVGHPEIFVGSVCMSLDLYKIHGVIRCKILPYSMAFHPVLPLKLHNKLFFPVCYSCCSELNQGECTHSDDERAITGTWVVAEVVRAVEMGYNIVEIYEIWNYKIEQYDEDTGESGLFSDMMNKFLKTKQEASGWPSTCETEKEKDAYIEEYYRKENVLLDKTNIVKNPGLRSFAKLCLNSFWGRFALRDNLPQTRIVKSAEVFYELCYDPKLTILSLKIINDETVLISYEYKDVSDASNFTSNVLIGAFTTTQARLKLFSDLVKLGERVLYYDTDSIIYVSKKESDGEYEPEKGDYLGMMTDELESYGRGSYITEFVTGGPKNYSFKVLSTNTGKIETVCKVKGFKLTWAVTQKVNFESIRDMVMKKRTEPISVPTMNMKRTFDHKVLTSYAEKQYRPVLTKRVFTNEGSKPYGYKKICSYL